MKSTEYKLINEFGKYTYHYICKMKSTEYKLINEYGKYTYHYICKMKSTEYKLINEFSLLIKHINVGRFSCITSIHLINKLIMVYL